MIRRPVWEAFANKLGELPEVGLVTRHMETHRYPDDHSGTGFNFKAPRRGPVNTSMPALTWPTPTTCGSLALSSFPAEMSSLPIPCAKYLSMRPPRGKWVLATLRMRLVLSSQPALTMGAVRSSVSSRTSIPRTCTRRSVRFLSVPTGIGGRSSASDSWQQHAKSRSDPCPAGKSRKGLAQDLSQRNIQIHLF